VRAFADNVNSVAGMIAVISSNAWSLLLKTPAAPNLFLQPVYFALREGEDEVAQLKCSVILQRTDESADDTGSGYNLAILRILCGLVDLLKLRGNFFGFRGAGHWSASVKEGEDR
jgi:hypothetical protein